MNEIKCRNDVKKTFAISIITRLDKQKHNKHYYQTATDVSLEVVSLVRGVRRPLLLQGTITVYVTDIRLILEILYTY